MQSLWIGATKRWYRVNDRGSVLLRQHIMDRAFGGRARWETIAGGTVNETWLVHPEAGEATIVRIGPSLDSIVQGPSWMRANALGCEQCLLHVVRPHLTQVPATIAAGFLPGYPPWVAQESVPGVPLSTVEHVLGPDDVQVIWRQVGTLVRQLHAIAAPWFGVPDGSVRFFDWQSMVVQDAAGLREDAGRMGLPVAPFDALVGRIHRHAGELGAVVGPRIVHSDLDARHVFIDRDAGGNWAISGMIDWEYGRYADPESEGLLLDMLDRHDDDPVRQAFSDGYGVVDTSDAAVARRGIYRGIALGWAVTDAVRCGESDRRLDDAFRLLAMQTGIQPE